MGSGISRREPEVHVVVVQSQENSKMNSKVLSTYSRGNGVTGQKQEFDDRKLEEMSQSSNSEEHLNDHELWTHRDSVNMKDPSEVSKLQQNSGENTEKEDSDVEKKDSPVSTRKAAPALKKRTVVKAAHTKTQDSKKAGKPKNSTAGVRVSQQEQKKKLSDSSQKGKKTAQYSQQSSIQMGHYSSNQLSSFSTNTMDTVPEDMAARGKLNGGGMSDGKAFVGEELSTISESKGNMFELFKASDGEEYTVYLRDDGKRFYVDFEEQKWRYFPDSWCDRGTFNPMDYDPYQTNQSVGENLLDVRKGEFIHPTRGKIATYLKQESMNVLYFFDEGSGTWLPMPLSWERHMPAITAVISEIQTICPDWRDARGIVAMLRSCNYNLEECTSSYMAIHDDGVLDYSDHGPGKDPFKSKAEKKLKETMAELSEAKIKCKEMGHQLELLQAKVEELEADNARMKKEMDSGKAEQRKKSRMMSRQLSQSFNMSQRAQHLEVIRPLVHILGEESRSLRAKFTTFRHTSIKGLNGFTSSFQQLSKGLTQLVVVHRRQAKEVVEVRMLYRKEAMQRRLLFNEVQELRGNIRVFCRCRYDDRGSCALKFENGEIVVCRTPQGRKKTFEFERVYTPDTTQEKVFEDTRPTITSCADGYNVCIIAYGQTGAGKTYTMMGPRDNIGVNLRSMKELFKLCKERTRIKYTMRVNMVEVYNESIYDLLASPEDFHEKLTIQKKGKDIIVPGLVEVEVRSTQDILSVLKEGENNRTVASTKMNTNSSRSHLLFTLKVQGFDTVSKATSSGRLTLVDLAGSERISRSEASGIRLVEAAAINKSLSALGQVFASIRNGALHIPYRNSKLTHLLQPSIGGDSKTCMFVNISPLEENMAETVSTLEFGTNARQVELGKATKHVAKS